MAEFSRSIALAEVDRHPVRRRIEATPEEMAALARRLGLASLAGLVAEVTVAKRHGAITVTGWFAADVGQVCVVTLEPFVAQVHGEIDEDFTESEDEAEDGEVDIDLDTPEPLSGEALDAGELVAQCLALEIDPHPRAPGADLTSLEAPDADAIDPTHPFAALGNLKQKS